LRVNGADYVLTISPQGLKLTLKKKRNGLELAWADLIDGEAALVSGDEQDVHAADRVWMSRLTPPSGGCHRLRVRLAKPLWPARCPATVARPDPVLRAL
jgi:hypothetical protein